MSNNNLGVISSSTTYNTVRDYLNQHPPPDNCTDNEFMLHLDKCNSKDLPPPLGPDCFKRAFQIKKELESWKSLNKSNIIRELKLSKEVTADGNYLQRGSTGLVVSAHHPNLALITDLLANPSMTVKNPHMTHRKSKEVKDKDKVKKHKRKHESESKTGGTKTSRFGEVSFSDECDEDSDSD